MKQKTEKILEIVSTVVSFFVVAALVFEGLYLFSYLSNSEQSQKSEQEIVVDNPKSKNGSPREQAEEIVLPETFTLEIPFTSQAPLGDWSAPFDHSCEEATILMANYYLEGEKTIDPIKAGQEIREIVDFEDKTYGFSQDTSVAQTAQLIRDYYGYKVNVYYNVSADNIKKELVKGNAVIAPTAGRLLGNPYFNPPGPLYHMLIIKGYNQTDFITNDPGTRRGADYQYPYQVLIDALCDWDNGEILSEKPAIISVGK